MIPTHSFIITDFGGTTIGTVYGDTREEALEEALYMLVDLAFEGVENAVIKDLTEDDLLAMVEFSGMEFERVMLQ